MSFKKKTLTIISPVYNEEDVIKHFYTELVKVLDSFKDRYIYKILFVVDKCTDKSLQILRSISKKDSNVQVLALTSRFGHQMSLLAGIDNAHSDIVIMLDSDLQHPPELIPAMLEYYEDGYDIVYTIRREPGDKSRIKKFLSRLFYWIMNRLSELNMEEGVADYRLLSRRVVEIFQTEIRERNQFIRGLIGWVGFKNIGIHYQAKKRTYGTSKYTFGRMLRFAIHGIISFSKKPLEYGVLIGLIFALFGLSVAVLTFIQYFIYDTLPSGWTTLTILISTFGGIQLIFMGILGEYIGAIFDEVKARPHYIIEEKINIEE